MKKFFRSIRKKSQASKGPPSGGSPELGSLRGSTASLVIGYDVREKELSKLHKAAWTGDLSKVQQLAKKDPSPLDKEKRTPLHLACAQGHADIVRELLEWKAKTNVGDADSRTPLMKAVECRQEECVVLLLRERVELNSVDKDGCSCLHIAARDGLARIIKLLCQAGANLTIKNKEGLAPLHVAVKEKQEEVCRIILASKGQVDIEDNNLRTPLMYACQDGSVNLVKLLLDHGASTELKDAKGWTPDDCAVIQGHHACSQLITDHVVKQQRNSTASTPRSLTGSRSATPRGASPFGFSAAVDKDSVSFGLPVADAGGDESGDETLSKVSAKGAGSDSWGDDTDISLAEDKKNKDGSESDVDDNVLEEESETSKINLAKLVGYQHSESDDTESQKISKEKGVKRAVTEKAVTETQSRLNTSKSVLTESTPDGKTWGADDSPLTPRKSVSFKRDKELSQVHDIMNMDSEEESDDEATNPGHHSDLAAAGEPYFPSTPAGIPPPAYHLSPEKQRGHVKEEFMEELGLGDADDVSDMSEVSEPQPGDLQAAVSSRVVSSAAVVSDSDWDSTVKSDLTPRPGILKRWSKPNNQDEDDERPLKQTTANQELVDHTDWDSATAEDIPPPLPTSPQPKLGKVSEWESDIEEMVIQPLVKQTPREDSDWDSAFEAVTPRLNAGLAYRQVTKQDSDWDTTVETMTPRENHGLLAQQRAADDTILSEEDEAEAAITAVVHGTPSVPNIVKSQVSISNQPLGTATAHDVAITSNAASSVTKHVLARETLLDDDRDDDGDDQSSWDSEEDLPPSDAALPLPIDAALPSLQQQKQQLQVRTHEGMSDTDDEMDETEAVSEWELERIRVKGQEQKPLEGDLSGQKWKHQIEDDDLINLTGFSPAQKYMELPTQGKDEEENETEAEMEERDNQGHWEQGETVLHMDPTEEAGEEKLRQESSAHRQWEMEKQENAQLLLQLQELEKDDASRLLQWKQEEADREDKQHAEVKEALLGKNILHDIPSSEEDSVVHEEFEKPIQPQMSKSTKRPIMDFCGNNSGTISNTTLSVDQPADVFLSRQELKNSKEQVNTETNITQIVLNAPSSIKTSAVSSSHVTAGRSPHLSQGFHASASSPAMGSVTQQIRQRLHVGSTYMGNHNDGLESDDSVASDSERVDVTKYYPNLLGNAHSSRLDFNIADDDVLSFTSTEFESDLPPSAVPFSQDILLNLDLTDPASVVHVQDHMREMRRQVEQEKNQRSNLESKLRLLGKEKQDLFKKIESLSESKRSLEQNNLELEAKLRSLEYSLSEETEKKNNAELLLVKTKEQLVRKEQQFTSEVEAKQQAELTMRNIQLEMRAAQNTIKELEEEREELERHLEHEHNARKLQEQINDEQMRLVQQHDQEKLSASRVEHGQGESGVDGSGQVERDKLNAEIYALKMEMERQRSRLKDEISLIYTENEELQAKIEDLRNELKLNEEAFAHATIQYNMQAGSLRTEVIAINSALDKERATREKLDAELDSLQKRMLSLGQEKDKAVQVRNELEREIQRERQAWVLDMEHKEDEINNLKDSIQHQNQRILGMESKLSAMENELHVSSTLLMERTSQLQHLKQEAERYKAVQDNFDSNIRLEKELTTKLQVKIENLQERLTHSQHEVLSLKQQLESQHAAGLAASSSDSNEKLNTIISSLRSDNDRAKGMLEERNNSLLEQVSQLKEEARNADNRCITLEAECRRLQADLAEVSCKLSLSEAQLQMMIKARDELEHECGRLKLEVEKSNQKSGIAQEKVLEAQTRVSELTERLDRAERTSTQHLANTSASFTAFTRSKEELEDNMHRLQVDNARLEAELRHERDRAEMLQAELTDSDKVRNSLEALCSNLKSTTTHLEEKLGDEAASRVIFASEARDSKGLLEQELAARSRLGLRVVRLEKANKMAQIKMEEARRMTGDLEGQNASLEAQLAEKNQTTVRLQKEVANLRAHLKTAKKKLKEGGNTALPLGASQYLEFQKEIPTESGKVSTPRGGSGGDNNIDSHHHFHHICKKEGGFSDLENLQQELEAKYRRELNRKLEEVNVYLENQARANDRLNNSHSENEARLQADKRRLEEENTNLRLQYEQAMAQRESRETEARRYKHLYESELRWRSRVGDQLFMSSSEKSLPHGLRLGSTERLKPKLHNSIGNLSMSALTDGYVDSSQVGANRSEALSNKIRAELDRSIAKHLEAAPHKDIVPVVHESEHLLLNHSLAQSSRDYIQALKRKYCV